MQEPRELIKISEACKITGLCYTAILRRIELGIIKRVQGIDIPNSKKRTIRLYKDEVLKMLENKQEVTPAKTKVTVNFIKHYDEILDF